MGDRYQLGVWLNSVLKEKGWSQADLARHAGIERAVINKIIKLKSKPLPETLTAIAKALNLPQEEIYVKAGIMGKPKEFDPDVSRLIHRLSLLSKDELQDIDDFVQYKVNKKVKDVDVNKSDDGNIGDGAAKAPLDH